MSLLDLLLSALELYAFVGVLLFAVHVALLPPSVAVEVWGEIRGFRVRSGHGRLFSGFVASVVVFAAALCVMGEWVLMWPWRLRALLAP